MTFVRSFFAVVAAIVLAQAASAQSFAGAGINPGDNVPAGGTSVVNVPGGTIPALANFRVEIDVTWTTAHTWIGDVITTIQGPNGTTIDLFRRVGKSDAAAGDGDSSNLLGTYTFRDSATQRLIDAAAPIADAVDIPVGAYRATNNTFNLNGTPGFTGEVAQTLDGGTFGATGDGNWTLFFSDNVGADYGPVNGWVLRFVPVPEPTSMLALTAGVVGLAGVVRRRFRKTPVAA